MAANSWNLAPGLNNVGSFQVSGMPFVSGSCIAPASGSSLVVRFPAVTKWFQIEPLSGSSSRSVRVAFSENGLYGKGGSGGAQSYDGYNFRLNASSSFCRPLDMKISEVWLMSEDDATYTVDILAGLTHIPSSRTTTVDRAIDGVVQSAGPNWSGSIGVG